MFVQSPRVNMLFIAVLVAIIACAYVIGELWIHGKALFLFPRYYQKLVQAEQKQQSYELSAYEKQVLRKFGRMIVMVSTLLILVMSLMLLVERKCPLSLSLTLIVISTVVLLYQYHRSYRD